MTDFHVRSSSYKTQLVYRHNVPVHLDVQCMTKTLVPSSGVLQGGCFPQQVCEPACFPPEQRCHLECECSPGFATVAAAPLTCVNINDCDSTPCQHGGVCVDLIEDYRCQCPVDWNRGMWLHQVALFHLLFTHRISPDGKWEGTRKSAIQVPLDV